MITSLTYRLGITELQNIPKLPENSSLAQICISPLLALRLLLLCVCVRAQSLSHVWLFVIPGPVACQAPLSMVFSRQEYWSGLPFLSPGDLPWSGIKTVSPESPALAGQFFTTEPPGKPLFSCHHLRTDVFPLFWDSWFWLLAKAPLLSATWPFLL